MSESGREPLKTRKSYSCIPCRRKKIKCSKTRPCSYCDRKRIVCLWPPNGVPAEGHEGTSQSAPSPLEEQITPTAGLDASTGPYVSTVAEGEQLDHSILSSHAAMGKRRRLTAFPFEGPAGERGGLLKGLPGRADSDRLLRTYLERVEWIHHPLHIPTFLSQYNAFYESSRSDQSHRSRWLALLYIVLCLGAHFGDEEDVGLEEQLLEGCEECLAAYDFLNHPSIETIQTIICLNLFLNNQDQVSAARALLAMVIRLAQAMGLSRIPDETDRSDEKNVVHRELGRRLWWSLVCQDAYTASNGGMTYSINLAHAITSPFGNLDDDEVRNGSPRPASRDPEEMTVSSYHLAKVRFALVVRDYIDAINMDFPNVPYSTILALDVRFRQVFSTLPAQLRPDLSQPFDPSLTTSKRYLVEQRAFMGVTLHNRLLRLHRAYMSRGYEDSRYTYSTKACLNSAYELLGLVRQCKVVLCKWWVVIVHVWTSGLVISVDMLRGEQDDGAKSKRRGGVELAISLLEPAARTSPVASRGVKVLRRLLWQAAAVTHQGESRAVAPGASTVDATRQDPAVHQTVDALSADSSLSFDDTNPMSINSTLALLESLFPAEFADWSSLTVDGNGLAVDGNGPTIDGDVLTDPFETQNPSF